jgi:hypothetical protein
MNVKELIDLLNEYDEDTEVLVAMPMHNYIKSYEVNEPSVTSIERETEFSELAYQWETEDYECDGEKKEFVIIH